MGIIKVDSKTFCEWGFIGKEVEKVLRMKRIVMMFSILIVFVFLFNGYADSKNAFVVGALIPLQTIEGIDIRRGVELAVKDVNRVGGVLGQPLKVVFEDTGVTMAEIVDVKKLVEAYKASVVLGGYSSGVSREAVDYLWSHRIFQIPIGSDYPFFNVIDLGEVLGNELGKFALEDSGAERVGIMAIDNAIGIEMQKSIKRVVEQAGGKIVSEIRYKTIEKESKVTPGSPIKRHLSREKSIPSVRGVSCSPSVVRIAMKIWGQAPVI